MHTFSIRLCSAFWEKVSKSFVHCVISLILLSLFAPRSGSRMGNWRLYPQALQEMGRVCRPLTGRAVLLTHDNRALSQVMDQNKW